MKSYFKKLDYAEIGQNSKFYKIKERNKNVVGNYGLAVWQGFKSSVDIFNGIPMLNLDFSTRVLRTESALDRLRRNQKSQELMKNALIGSCVIANYANCRIYQIKDVDFTRTPMSKFQSKDGSEMTYFQYYS